LEWSSCLWKGENIRSGHFECLSLLEKRSMVSLGFGGWEKGKVLTLLNQIFTSLVEQLSLSLSLSVSLSLCFYLSVFISLSSPSLFISLSIIQAKMHV
jgi:hypothetical protein